MRRFLLVGFALAGCASADPDAEASVEPRAHAEANAHVARERSQEHRAADRSPEPQAERAAEIDARFTGTLLAIAREYREWKAVDDELRFAPQLCRSPMPGRLHFSESDDATTHGEKLYLLYAKDPVAYGFPPTFGGMGPAPTSEPTSGPPIEQAIVKESFAALAHDSEGRPPAGVDGDPLSWRPALRDGVLHSAGEALDLYVMVKLPADTPGTDTGWVYGTLTPDGGTVTSAGRVKSCMGCHESAPHDRLFGRKPAPANARPAANAAPH
jgi:hypothetical protein